VLEEAGGGVPVVLVEDDLAAGVEADVGDADRVDGLAALDGFVLKVHGPAEVVVAAAAGDVLDLDGHGVGVLHGFEEVFLDGGAAVEGLEGVVEEGVWGVDFAGVGEDVLLGEVGEVVDESGLGGGFLRATEVGAGVGLEEGEVFVDGLVGDGGTGGAGGEKDAGETGEEAEEHGLHTICYVHGGEEDGFFSGYCARVASGGAGGYILGK